MNGAGLGIIIVVALAVCAFLLWRALKPAPAAPVRAVSYRCVGIQPADPLMACDAVKGIAGQRFLPGQAPKLPLPDCMVDRCSCRYVHFDDRRGGSRRAATGIQVRRLQPMDWEERRHNRGRRKTDRRGMLDEAKMQAAIAEKRKRRGR
jgi:hypothetical protein